MAMIKFLIGIALILVGSTVWNSNWFHKEVFPKEYWSKQVALLEESIVMDQSMIRDAAIELKKLQLTANLEVAQEINTAKSLGFSTEDARRDAVEMIKMEVKDLRDDMEIWKEMLQKDREKLEKARVRLSQVQ